MQNNKKEKIREIYDLLNFTDFFLLFAVLLILKIISVILYFSVCIYPIQVIDLIIDLLFVGILGYYIIKNERYRLINISFRFKLKKLFYINNVDSRNL